MPSSPDNSPRTVGLWGATIVGCGAIVGGSILILAGVAYENAGPGVILAFALNGVIALLTAAAFAELSTAFPKSGGAYQFAKVALSLRAAFGVGWILWFAYLVAGVLFALGFGAFASAAIEELWPAWSARPWWLTRADLLLGALATTAYAAVLVRTTTSGGQWATVGKFVLFLVLITAGLVAVVSRPSSEIRQNLTPFLPHGALGLFKVMGFTFIALQGFSLVATIAGEIKNPRRTIPRAMFLSLAGALAIYLPLLFVVAAVGVPADQPGMKITDLAKSHPETLIATAASNFMGPAGYWLVMAAAILSTLTALHACLLAASRVVLAMAVDRTLPRPLARLHSRRHTPAAGVVVSAAIVIIVLAVVPSLGAAGAAASLIFLISYALTHGTCILVRRRGGGRTDAFRTPLFPAVPVIGGLACLALAIFQGIAVPSAGIIVLIWLAAGALLYGWRFARRAEAIDAFSLARHPELLQLRGRRPLVLTPVANPQTAASMVGLAHALAPRRIGRVLLLTVVRPPKSASDTDTNTGTEDSAKRPASDAAEELDKPSPLKSAQDVLGEALTAALSAGRAPQALMCVADDPWDEIGRVAHIHNCEVLLLGLSRLTDDSRYLALENLISAVDCDVVILRAPPDWRVDQAKRILVPIGGRSDHYRLRARLLGSLCRTGEREVVFVRVLPEALPPAERRSAQEALELLAAEEVPDQARAELAHGDDVAGTLIERAGECDLVILGVLRRGPHQKAISAVARRVIAETSCPVIMISRGK